MSRCDKNLRGDSEGGIRKYSLGKVLTYKLVKRILVQVGSPRRDLKTHIWDIPLARLVFFGKSPIAASDIRSVV